MSKALVVYWYAGDKLRRDGGGLRALAWVDALETAGYDVEIAPLWTIGGGVSRGSALSRAKRTLVPMPLSRPLPAAVANADLAVLTVPAVFGSGLRSMEGRKVVLDWMDLWSVNARNVGDAAVMSMPGGRIQSALWRRRESKWPSMVRANTFAGYEDFETARSNGGMGAWLPTPVRFPSTPPSCDGGGRTLGFIGNFYYEPNRLSLRTFLDRHIQSLQQAGAKLRVAGFGSEIVRAWGYPVEVCGQVDDVANFYASVDAIVVPLEHGGGIKVKAVEAFAYQRPVFGTDHVRGGFSPEFRPYIHPLESIADVIRTDLPEPVPADMLSRVFSEEAFRNGAARLLKESS